MNYQKANAELKYWCVYESESEWVSEWVSERIE